MEDRLRRLFRLSPKAAVGSKELLRSLVVDATPSYMLGTSTMRTMAEQFPNAKIVVILRDPAARAWSEYQMKVRRVARQLDLRQESPDNLRRLTQLEAAVKACPLGHRGQHRCVLDRVDWFRLLLHSYRPGTVHRLLTCLKQHAGGTCRAELPPPKESGASSAGVGQPCVWPQRGVFRGAPTRDWCAFPRRLGDDGQTHSLSLCSWSVPHSVFVRGDCGD